jgi:hypothetical protein
LTLLEPAELLLLLEEFVGAGELVVELGFERVELGVELEVGPAPEELKVTPCTELDKAQRTADRMLTYHSATHLRSSSKGLFEIRTGTVLLNATSGRIDKRLVAAQACGVLAGARNGIGGQTGEGTGWNE